MTIKSIIVIFSGIMLATAIIAYFSLTVFVIQPIGALPEGQSLVTKRVGKIGFLGSADAICEQETGRVSLFCRGIIMSRFLEEATVYFRLPYSETLYLWSTGGKEYGRQG